jgi:hypothetical protein
VQFWTNSNDECGLLCDTQRAFVKRFKSPAKKLQQQARGASAGVGPSARPTARAPFEGCPRIQMRLKKAQSFVEPARLILDITHTTTTNYRGSWTSSPTT